MDCTIQYMISEEEKYINEHSSDSLLELRYTEDKLSFLSEQPFRKSYEHLQSYSFIEEKSVKNITDAEELIFFLMIGKYSYHFRHTEDISTLPQILQCMLKLWESFLSKVPICENNIVYRYCHYNDKTDWVINDIWNCPFSLTTREGEWTLNKDENRYKIHLLPDGKTRARAIWKIHNHGANCGNPENQVNFF